MTPTHETTPGVQDPARAERTRLRRVYDAYDRAPRYRRLWREGPAQRFMRDRKWSVLEHMVRATGIDPRPARVLDLGSGTAGDGSRFADFGVDPSRIVVFDLNPEYARAARGTSPGLQAVAGDASVLPFRDRAFDVVHQSTMLSSVLDRGARRLIAGEIARVLVPGGLFISYDVRYRNPWNRHTRPIGAGDLRRMMPGWDLSIRSVTGIPHILRLVAPISIAACRAVEAIPLLRSHYLAVLRKPAG